MSERRCGGVIAGLLPELFSVHILSFCDYAGLLCFALASKDAYALYKAHCRSTTIPLAAYSAAASGSVSILYLLRSCCRDEALQEAFKVASQHGQLDAMRFFHDECNLRPFVRVDEDEWDYGGPFFVASAHEQGVAIELLLSWIDLSSEEECEMAATDIYHGRIMAGDSGAIDHFLEELGNGLFSYRAISEWVSCSRSRDLWKQAIEKIKQPHLVVVHIKAVVYEASSVAPLLITRHMVLERLADMMTYFAKHIPSSLQEEWEKSLVDTFLAKGMVKDAELFDVACRRYPRLATYLAQRSGQ